MPSSEEIQSFKNILGDVDVKLSAFTLPVIRDLVNDLDDNRRKIELMRPILEKMANEIRELLSVVAPGGRGIFKGGPASVEADRQMFQNLFAALNSYDAIRLSIND